MKFEDKYGIIYCKNNPYIKVFDNEYYCQHTNITYYRGYLVHKISGPAIEYNSGSKCWYKNGIAHRENGPAKEYNDGSKYWYLNGIEYNEKEYWKLINLKNKSRVLNDI
jgi:hypothetical protein